MSSRAFSRRAYVGTVARDGGIGIEADPVAEATAEHLVHGNLVGLAGKIPEGHLHAADTASLPAVGTKLLESPEQAFDVAGILTQETALEHECVAGTAPVPNFAVARKALVRVDPDDRHLHGSASNLGDPEIGDSEV